MTGEPEKDGLVVIVEDQTPDNIAAFWSHEIPADWQGIQSLEQRIAAIAPLPLLSLIYSFCLVGIAMVVITYISNA